MIKSNYKPLSILPLLSKVYERGIYSHLSDYRDSFLNKIMHFLKTHRTQHALFKLLLSWQQGLDNGGFKGAILMDSSKVHNCICHNLLITKLEYFGLDKASLRFLLDYLTCRKQRSKIGSSFSLGVILIQVYHKGQSLVLSYLIYLSMIYFSIKSQKCVILQMIRLFSVMIKI